MVEVCGMSVSTLSNCCFNTHTHTQINYPVYHFDWKTINRSPIKHNWGIK